jgi:hypothetical protein
LKKLAHILAIVLSFVLLFGGVTPALAQTTTEDLGTTTIYNTKEAQEREVKVFQDAGYAIAAPFELPENIMIPPTKEEFDTKVVPSLVKALGDGSVTKAWLDFQGLESTTAGGRLFSVKAPLGQKIYSVVAGKPLQQCPLEIEDTQIAFFSYPKKIDGKEVSAADQAINKAKELDKEGYVIYVSPSVDLRKKSLDTLYDAYSSGQNPDCFLVTGETKRVTVDFEEIFNLLPPDLQQPAKETPFVFFPKDPNGFLYVVNARNPN